MYNEKVEEGVAAAEDTQRERMPLSDENEDVDEEEEERADLDTRRGTVID